MCYSASSISPLVSVVIPVHNRARICLRALHSVLKQTYTHFEVLLVNDGSEDWHEIVGRAPECAFDGDSICADPRVQIVHHERCRGVAAARNSALKVARGTLLAFLDSDDCWMPTKLARQVKYMQEHPHAVLCHCEELWIRNGRRVNPRNIHFKAEGNSFLDCLEMCRISPSATVLRKSLLEELGGFDERFRVCEDYELWLRVAAKYKIHFLGNALLEKHGGHGDQLSRSAPAIDRFRVFAITKLLTRDTLSPSQEHAARTMCRDKLSVLLQGALKRGNTTLASATRSLLSRLECVRDGEECIVAAQDGHSLESLGELLVQDSMIVETTSRI